MFAAKPFAAGEVVAVWGGKVYTAEEVGRLARCFPHFDTHTVSVWPGYYLGSENLFECDDAELFNQSCNAYVGIRGQIVLVARRAVPAGVELTFDYDKTEVAAKPFECQCDDSKCWGNIDGSPWRGPGFVEQNRAFLSWHILELLRQDREGGRTTPRTSSDPGN